MANTETGDCWNTHRGSASLSCARRPITGRCTSPIRSHCLPRPIHSDQLCGVIPDRVPDHTCDTITARTQNSHIVFSAIPPIRVRHSLIVPPPSTFSATHGSPPSRQNPGGSIIRAVNNLVGPCRSSFAAEERGRLDPGLPSLPSLPSSPPARKLPVRLTTVIRSAFLTQS